MSDLSRVSEAQEYVKTWRDFYAAEMVRTARGGDQDYHLRFVRRMSAVAAEQRGNLEKVKAQRASSYWPSERVAEYERAVETLEQAAKEGR